VYYAAVITLCVANQKGGVGKTTSTLTFGAMLADTGRRVLLVDLDPQSSLTSGLGIDAAGRSMAEVMGGGEPGKIPLASIVREIRPGLCLAPGDMALAACELGLTARLGRENVLRQALANVAHRFDVVLIDCPPSLGLLTVNALTAAAGVIAPTLPSAPDLRALRLFLETLDKVRAINPALQLAGVIISQYDSRLTAHREVMDLLAGADLPLWLPAIPRSVRVQEASGQQTTLLDYDPNGRVTAAYQELLTGGLTEWLKRNEK
jgi:chromosome partitioning protein